MDKMIANGDTPLCVGIESGPATGWPFTDWVEELVLREQGIDYYNQWVDHEVPFNDQPVVDAFNEVAGPDGMWTKKGAVFSSGGSIAATAFGDNGQPLVEGKCMMHRQANFFSRLLPRGHASSATARARSARSTSRPTRAIRSWSAASAPAAFRDAPEVWKVMQYLGSAEFANARQAAQSQAGRRRQLSGFLTGQHEGRHEQLERRSSRASSRSWRPPTRRRSTPPTRCRPKSARARSGPRATSFVNGDEDAKTAAANIQASWPS